MKTLHEMILFYNLNPPDVMKKWKGICFRMGIRVKEVVPEQFHQPLGYLVGLPGFEAAEPTSQPDTFSEPMLVLQKFTGKRMEELWRQSKKAGVPNVPLKAVLTVHNSTWDSVTLYQELCRERQALQTGETVHPNN